MKDLNALNSLPLPLMLDRIAGECTILAEAMVGLQNALSAVLVQQDRISPEHASHLQSLDYIQQVLESLGGLHAVLAKSSPDVRLDTTPLCSAGILQELVDRVLDAETTTAAALRTSADKGTVDLF